MLQQRFLLLPVLLFFCGTISACRCKGRRVTQSPQIDSFSEIQPPQQKIMDDFEQKTTPDVVEPASKTPSACKAPKEHRITTPLASATPYNHDKDLGSMLICCYICSTSNTQTCSIPCVCSDRCTHIITPLSDCAGRCGESCSSFLKTLTPYAIDCCKCLAGCCECCCKCLAELCSG